MRIQAMTTMAAGLGISAWAGQPAPVLDRSVTVCFVAGRYGFVRETAQPLATKIFAEIGIRIDWRRDAQACAGKDDAIVISLSSETPATRLPGAWAYALPYEGTHIVVFYDRVQKTVRNDGAHYLLSYVLVHEIAHILEGVGAHSETGIMKAPWDSVDYFEMARGRMRFASWDIGLIHQGLDARKARPSSSNPHP